MGASVAGQPTGGLEGEPAHGALVSAVPVDPAVRLEVGRLREAAIALPAFVRALAGVYQPVAEQSGRHGEAFPARHAQEGPHAGVRALVERQAGRVAEVAWAERAAVAGTGRRTERTVALSIIVPVGALVGAERGELPEATAATGTDEGAVVRETLMRAWDAGAPSCPPV